MYGCTSAGLTNAIIFLSMVEYSLCQWLSTLVFLLVFHFSYDIMYVFKSVLIRVHNFFSAFGLVRYESDELHHCNFNVLSTIF